MVVRRLRRLRRYPPGYGRGVPSDPLVAWCAAAERGPDPGSPRGRRRVRYLPADPSEGLGLPAVAWTQPPAGMVAARAGGPRSCAATAVTLARRAGGARAAARNVDQPVYLRRPGGAGSRQLRGRAAGVAARTRDAVSRPDGPLGVSGRLLTVERVAELTGLSRRSVYRAVDAGELDAYRLRGRVRIPEAALDAWLEAHRVSPRQRPRPTAGSRSGAAPSSELRRILLSESPDETRPGRSAQDQLSHGVTRAEDAPQVPSD